MIKYYKKMLAGVINIAIKNNGEWKILVFAMPVFQAINLLTLLILIKYLTNLGFTIPTIKLFASSKLNDTISGMVFFLLPFVLVNYYILIYKDKYKILIKEYPIANGKLMLYYLLISFFAFAIPAIIGVFFN